MTKGRRFHKAQAAGNERGQIGNKRIKILNDYKCITQANLWCALFENIQLNENVSRKARSNLLVPFHCDSKWFFRESH